MFLIFPLMGGIYSDPMVSLYWNPCGWGGKEDPNSSDIKVFICVKLACRMKAARRLGTAKP